MFFKGRACMFNQHSEDIDDLIYQNMESSITYWFTNNYFQCSNLQYYKDKIMLNPDQPSSLLQRDIRFLGVNSESSHPTPIIEIPSQHHDLETDLDKLRKEVQSRFEELNEKLILFKIRNSVPKLKTEAKPFRVGKLDFQVAVKNINDIKQTIEKLAPKEIKSDPKRIPGGSISLENHVGRKLLSITEDVLDKEVDIKQEKDVNTEERESKEKLEKAKGELNGSP